MRPFPEWQLIRAIFEGYPTFEGPFNSFLITNIFKSALKNKKSAKTTISPGDIWLKKCPIMYNIMKNM